MTTPTYVVPIDTVELIIALGALVSSAYVYTPVAMINMSRSFKRTVAATANEIPRTDDPTQPNKIVRTTVSLDTEVTGSGMMDVASWGALEALVASGQPSQFQITQNYVGGSIYTGPFVITSLEMTGQKHGNIIEATISMSQADVLTVTTVTTVISPP